MSPDLPQLVRVARNVAAAMHVTPPPDGTLEPFLHELLFGERDLWAAWRSGIITEVELRNAMLARVATFLCAEAGVREPSAELWATAELERAMELGLYRRAAMRTAWDDEVEAKQRER